MLDEKPALTAWLRQAWANVSSSLNWFQAQFQQLLQNAYPPL